MLVVSYVPAEELPTRVRGAGQPIVAVSSPRRARQSEGPMGSAGDPTGASNRSELLGAEQIKDGLDTNLACTQRTIVTSKQRQERPKMQAAASRSNFGGSGALESLMRTLAAVTRRVVSTRDGRLAIETSASIIWFCKAWRSKE